MLFVVLAQVFSSGIAYLADLLPTHYLIYKTTKEKKRLLRRAAFFLPAGVMAAHNGFL